MTYIKDHIFELRRKIWRHDCSSQLYRQLKATKILVHAFMTSHLDYCNSLLSEVPQYQLNRLQKILNIAARLVCLVPKFDHITHYLIDLHWLPVAFRIKFKVLIFVFKALNGVAPRYISDLIRKKSMWNKLPKPIQMAPNIY